RFSLKFTISPIDGSAACQEFQPCLRTSTLYLHRYEQRIQYFRPYGILLSLAYSAPTKADPMSHKLYKNLIGGEWVAAKTGKTFLNINPADKNDIVGEFQSSGADDVDAAVK